MAVSLRISDGSRHSSANAAFVEPWFVQSPNRFRVLPGLLEVIREALATAPASVLLISTRPEPQRFMPATPLADYPLHPLLIDLALKKETLNASTLHCSARPER